MLLPSVTASAYDQTEANEMLESGSISFYELEEEPDLVSSIFFTEVGENEDVIVKDRLEANTTYTLHFVIQNRSHNDIRETTLYAPLVAEPVKMSAAPTDKPNSLSFTLKGRMLGDEENPEQGVEYLHLLDLSSDDGKPMELRYVPNTARCYSVTWQGEEREAALSDMELCSKDIGAFVSSEIERYGSDEEPKFRVDTLGGVGSSGRLCEVRLTVETSEGKGGMSVSNALAIIIVGVIAFFVVLVVVVAVINHTANSKSNPNKDVEH